MTSLDELATGATMEVVDNALRRQFERLFGPTYDASAPCEAMADASA